MTTISQCEQADKVSLPSLSADLLLIHAPAFFDFRGRRDVYFPFLGTSGDVPITPLYEYFPIGFKTLQRYLADRGHDVKLMNLSTVLLRYPRIAFSDLVQALDVQLIGIDLHWMVHVQGSLAVAEELKRTSGVPIIFGGISSTYYAEELIRYPFIDMVMRGYDTHEPMHKLLTSIKASSDLHEVENLLWKDDDGSIHDNEFSYVPSTFGCGVDWSKPPPEAEGQSLPILEILATQNAGCVYNCGWCGGSREAFRRIFKRKRAIARRPPSETQYEFETLRRLPDSDRYHFYAVGSYNETKQGLDLFLDQVARSNIQSISYEQFHLTSSDVLQRMVAANSKTIITLSPESHDPTVAKLAGRGVYSNDELEQWLELAMEVGVHQVDVWYFIGMPEQDEKSAMETVDYCHRLLTRFQGLRVNPMICPMIPFLDPASTFFEHPQEHGYRVFYRTAEEHRRGMERASLINRINYETKWLSRSDLVHVGFRAVSALMQAKADLGFFPRSWARKYRDRIADALEFIDIVHEVDCLPDAASRSVELEKLGDEILRRNDQIFFSGVMNQAFPINRQIGGRWFDELGWDSAALEAGQSLEA